MKRARAPSAMTHAPERASPRRTVRAADAAARTAPREPDDVAGIFFSQCSEIQEVDVVSAHPPRAAAATSPAASAEQERIAELMTTIAALKEKDVEVRAEYTAKLACAQQRILEMRASNTTLREKWQRATALNTEWEHAWRARDVAAREASERFRPTAAAAGDAGGAAGAAEVAAAVEKQAPARQRLPRPTMPSAAASESQQALPSASIVDLTDGDGDIDVAVEVPARAAAAAASSPLHSEPILRARSRGDSAAGLAFTSLDKSPFILSTITCISRRILLTI